MGIEIAAPIGQVIHDQPTAKKEAAVDEGKLGYIGVKDAKPTPNVKALVALGLCSATAVGWGVVGMFTPVTIATITGQTFSIASSFGIGSAVAVPGVACALASGGWYAKYVKPTKSEK